MALISLPLHWTSEGKNHSSNGRHRLPGNSILISLPFTEQRRRRRQKLKLFPPVFFFSSIFPFYWFSALCEECKFVMKVTRVVFLIELRRSCVTTPKWWPVFQNTHNAEHKLLGIIIFLHMLKFHITAMWIIQLICLSFTDSPHVRVLCALPSFSFHVSLYTI